MEDPKQYHKGLALVIGINDYDQTTKLDKAVNDATAFKGALEKLNFYVKFCTDCNIKKWDAIVDEFTTELHEFDVGVFYFAGHGVELEGVNYLLAKDTPIDNASGIKRYSMQLQDIITKMHASGCEMNIVIIDACRDNPYGGSRTGIASMRLAPIFAPKGTIIAYSTSPGERAKDGGMGDNSIYTGAILQYIFEEELPVEELFKQVRTTVYALTKGEQTSWEHTSLIGKFSFNSGQLIHSQNLKYSPKVIVDKDFDISDPIIGNIVCDFRSYNYNIQASALARFSTIPLENLNNNQLFVIGRNILQAATGDCWDCINFLKNTTRLASYTKYGENHLLNGILYEIYFNSDGTFRSANWKNRHLNELMKLCKRKEFENSFLFIHGVLQPFAEKLLFIPSSNPQTTAINVLLRKDVYKNEWMAEGIERLFIESVKYENRELLTPPTEKSPFSIFLPHIFNNKEELETYLCEIYAIPNSYINLIFNVKNIDIELQLNQGFK